MMMSYILALLVPPDSETLTITSGRDYAGLRDYETVIRGTCDGRPASFTITAATRQRPGRLVLRGGSFERELPVGFLDGSLVTNGLYYTGLACDGERLHLSSEAIRDIGDDIILVRQNAVLDLGTGALTLRELKRLSPEETRSELTDGRDIAIDSSGRLDIR